MAQQQQGPSPSGDTDRMVPGTEQMQGTGMDYTEQMPMPKRKKRNNGKRDGS